MATKQCDPGQIPEANLDLFNYLREAYRRPVNNKFLPYGPIRVDDQHGGDVDGMFCTISATISERTAGEFLLQLRNSPMPGHLRELIEDRNGDVLTDERMLRADAGITVSIKRVTLIRELANAYRRTVGRGNRYLDPCWKWVCPRTADSLDRLADNIRNFRHEQRLSRNTR